MPPAPSRRACLRGAALAAVWLLASAHTPYGQWVVYRQRRLLIGSSRAEPASYELGKRVAAALLEALPESMARVSRAPDKFRLASLLGTGQMDVALLRPEDAAALAEGRDPFRDYGGVPLAALYAYGDYVLVSRADFPERHAWLVSRALDTDSAAAAVPGGALPKAAGDAPRAGGLPVHPGTRAYAEGRPPPAAPEAAAGPDDHGHGH